MGGAPFAWPQQILWQKVSFRHDYDGLGDVALGDTTVPGGASGSGPNGRSRPEAARSGSGICAPISGGIGGAEADAVYSGTDIVPLLSQATVLEFGGGLTGRININVSVFANVDYEFAVGAVDNNRNGVRRAFGAKYAW
jgi:hypothetical protein